MPTTFHDGPAAGLVLSLLRCPILLRVAQNDAGTWRALAELTDMPAEEDTVTVYRRVQYRTVAELQSQNTKAVCPEVEYEMVVPQPAIEVGRDLAKWRAWAQQEAKKGTVKA